MDPVTAVGLVASITQLLEITVDFVKYVNAVKKAPQSRVILAIEATSLLSLLTNLRYRLEQSEEEDGEWYLGVKSLGGKFGPLDQLSAEFKTLNSKLKLRFGGSLTWPLAESSIRDTLQKIERLKTYVGLTLQNDQFALSQAVKADLLGVSNNLADVKRKLDGLDMGLIGARQSLKGAEEDSIDQDRRKLAEWLSPLDFIGQQNDTFARRQEQTGQWLLESDQFRDWVSTTGKVLFCPGIPGAGKTVLTSTVVNYLSKIFEGTKRCTACMYCSHQESTRQTPVNLLASILKQLIQQGHPISDYLRRLYELHSIQSSRPKFEDISGLLRIELDHFDRIFVVVDAFDECDDELGVRDVLLNEFRNMKNINLMITSRPHISIGGLTDRMTHIEIRANSEDLRQYVDGRITQHGRLAKHVMEHPDLQEDIRNAIVGKAHGMFLLSRLHMDSLVSKTTCKAVRKALQTLPNTLDDTYKDAMARIEGQVEDEKDLAHRILSWLSYAFRPMTVAEMRHGLAVELTDTMLDHENLPDEDTLTSVCAGLVIIDQESGIIRLIHYTTREFFERNRRDLFPNGNLDVARSCLTYLSFEMFATVCKTDEEMETRLEKMAFLAYAARYWGDHARNDEAGEVETLVLEFLADKLRMASSIQAQSLPVYQYTGYSQRFPRGVSGSWLAAFFGLRKVVEIMLREGCHVNDVDAMYGWTALHRASENGHIHVMGSLLDRGASVEIKDSAFGRTALYQAIDSGNKSAVQILLDRGAEVNLFDETKATPLHIAASNGSDEIVSLLLSNGADSKAIDTLERVPLHCATIHGYTSVVSLLVDAGATVDARDRPGWTSLAMAADCGHLSVAQTLVRYGADVHVRDKDGATPLHHCAWNGHPLIAVMLIENGADIEAPEQDGWSPLQFAAWRGHESVVTELLKKGANVGARSKDGWTALHRAIWNQHTEAVKSLLAGGADTGAKDSNGESVLQQAAWKGCEDILKLIIDTNVDINAKSDKGETALHWAASNGHDGAVALLVQHGADIHAKSKCNETAMEQAAEHKEISTFEILSRFGAANPVPSRDDGTKSAEELPPPSLQWHLTGLASEAGQDSPQLSSDFEVTTMESPDPAVLAVLSLNFSNTSIFPCSSSGFSRKAKIISVVNGTECTFFMKRFLDSDAVDIFAGEHCSLNAMHSVVPSLCPRSFGYGQLSSSSGCFLVTEFLERQLEDCRSTNALTLAQKLALLHKEVAPTPAGYERPVFGFPAPTICGPTIQPNSYHHSWKTFFIENRLHAIQRACEASQGPDDELRYWIEMTIDKVVPALLEDGHLGGQDGILPVTVHGNLWYGNKMRGRVGRRGRVEDIIFDPSSCFAHSEFELGIMKLFGGFGAGFFLEYHRLVPKTEPRNEYDDRIELYLL